jgi:hypothetical protein
VSGDTPNLKTSVRVLGQDQVDDFAALCALRGRRPHELAADMVLDAIRAARQDPQTAPFLRTMRRARRMHRAGFRLVSGADR